jgi:hypothetical protein
MAWMLSCLLHRAICAWPSCFVVQPTVLVAGETLIGPCLPSGHRNEGRLAYNNWSGSSQIHATELTRMGAAGAE